MIGALDELVGESIASQNFRALRRWKNREMTRIALRELANFADLEETTGEANRGGDHTGEKEWSQRGLRQIGHGPIRGSLPNVSSTGPSVTVVSVS